MHDDELDSHWDVPLVSLHDVAKLLQDRKKGLEFATMIDPETRQGLIPVIEAIDIIQGSLAALEVLGTHRPEPSQRVNTE